MKEKKKKRKWAGDKDASEFVWGLSLFRSGSEGEIERERAIEIRVLGVFVVYEFVVTAEIVRREGCGKERND